MTRTPNNFTSRHAGKCEACLSRFAAGTSIRRSPGGAGYIHADGAECAAGEVARQAETRAWAERFLAAEAAR